MTTPSACAGSVLGVRDMFSGEIGLGNQSRMPPRMSNNRYCILDRQLVRSATGFPPRALTVQ